MSITETAAGLGSWEIRLSERTPKAVTDRLDFFGHIAVVNGRVDVEAVGDGLLTQARYVGVHRGRDKETGRTLLGSGMTFWLGDEDGKGYVFEDELDLSGMTLAAAVAAVLGPVAAVTVGTVHPKAGTMGSGSTYRYRNAREVLGSVCDAFGVEFRVNGDASVDVGTTTQLYGSTPKRILIRKGAGADIDLTALAGRFEVTEAVWDWSSRVVLLGRTADDGEFATGSADAPSVSYLDLHGNPVVSVRTISESGETEGTVDARAALQINRYNRTARSLKLDADDYDISGGLSVGEMLWVYDPDTGIVNPANEVFFQGQIWHPDSIRLTGSTWPVAPGMTVAFRTGDGVWLDLTDYVTDESGRRELTVGDLPKTLGRPGDSTVQIRYDAVKATAPDGTVPAAPTGLTLTTVSGISPLGATISTIHAEWTAPTLNGDGTTLIDFSHFLVERRWTGRSPLWESALVTSDTEIDIRVEPSLPYEVRVAAVDISGHVSPWSAVVGITSAADGAAPPAPADLVLSSYLGNLRIEYQGTDNLGNPMPSDAQRVDIFVGESAGFTPSAANRLISFSPWGKAAAYATGMPYGEPGRRWAKAIAYDRDGNASPASAAVSGTVSQVAAGDIASVNIGSLVSGTGTFDLILAGTIMTASAGQRTGMTSLGFLGWNAAEVQTIRLDGIDNLLVGRLSTDVSPNRRISVGSAGSLGELTFWSPDGKQSFVRSYTEATGVEAIQFGMRVDASTSSLWNRINYNTDEWSNYRARKHDFYYLRGGVDGAFFVRSATGRDGTGAVVRLSIDDSTTYFRDDSGRGRMSVDNNGTTYVMLPADGDFQVSHSQADGAHNLFVINGNGYESEHIFYAPRHVGDASSIKIRYRPAFSPETHYRSPRLQFLTQDTGSGLYGAHLKYQITLDRTDGTMVVSNVLDSGYERIAASSFDIASDQIWKRGITDVGPGALAKIRQVKAKRFTRLVPKGEKTVEEVGFLAQELRDLAPEMVTGEDGDLRVRTAAVLALALQSIGELADTVDELKKGLVL